MRLCERYHCVCIRCSITVKCITDGCTTGTGLLHSKRPIHLNDNCLKQFSGYHTRLVYMLCGPQHMCISVSPTISHHGVCENVFWATGDFRCSTMSSHRSKLAARLSEGTIRSFNTACYILLNHKYVCVWQPKNSPGLPYFRSFCRFVLITNTSTTTLANQ